MLYYNYVVVFIKHSILNKKCMKRDSYWQFK